MLRRDVTDRGDIVARGAELGLDLFARRRVVVVRAHHFAPTEDDWRARVLAVAERAARASAPGSIAAVIAPAARAPARRCCSCPEAATTASAASPTSIARELQARCTASPSPSATRAGPDPVDLYRAGNEALLAANVAEARPAANDEPSAVLAFEDTGAYRLLLPAMSEDPAELQRFYAETIEPLVAYDEQYETDLVRRSRPSSMRRQRRRHRPAALHPPPHGPLPARARARPLRP